MAKILYVGKDKAGEKPLKQLLGSVRTEWEIDQVSGTFESFHALQSNSYDAVIVDWESQEKEARTILEFVESSNSFTIRYVVSDFEDRRAASELASLVDQHFNPDTDIKEVAFSIERAISFNSTLKNDETRLVIGQMTHIPSIPSVYAELMDDIERDESSAASVASILGKDIAMTAKTLQLANSAYFGRQKEIAELKSAVRLIGFRTISSMALAVGVFQQMQNGVDNDVLEGLWDHSSRVASMAREVAAQVDPMIADEAFTAGMLHEIGTLVIAANSPCMYDRLGKEIFLDDKVRAAKEKEIFGATHEQIGAYLLGRWGLPERIVEAVAHHRHPREAHLEGFSGMTALHVSDPIVSANERKLEVEFEEICDVDYLKDCGVSQKIPAWSRLLEYVPEPVG